MIKRRLFKFATVALMVAMTMSFAACGKNGSDSVEATTQTDILAVEIVDKDGNKHTIEGVGVTDENGKTTITVTDKDGNKTVIEGTASKDEDGKTTVTGGTVVQGGTITKEDGTTIDTNGSKVEDVKDNNDGKIDTDVKVDETTKAEVESKKEEATKGEVSTQAPTKSEIADKETEKATEKETEASKENETTASKETEGQTQAPTTAPTQGATKPAETQRPTQAPTEAPTQRPTEAPTQKPMTEEEKAIAECLKNSRVTTDKPDRVSISYEGKAEKIVVPATYTDGRPITFFYLTSNSSVKEVVVLGANTMAQFQENHKLEKITTYANMIDSTLISTCSKIKEVNLLGDNITFIKNGFVQYHSLSYPTDFSGATLNINLKKIDDVMTYGHPVYLPDRMKTIEEYCATYPKWVEQHGLDYTFFNRDWASTKEYRNWFSKINYLK